MAVIVHTADASKLLNAIHAAISSGQIETWSVDADGDFTHSPQQWRLKGWFRPNVLANKIIFNILAPQDTEMASVTYGVYHGRFVEMLLVHFDTKFDRVTSTALPEEGDQV
jgi:hypothetical protein